MKNSKNKPARQLARRSAVVAGATAVLLGGAIVAQADPVVSRLTPPSALFTFGDPSAPFVSRFLPDQRFDLQATVKPDAGQEIEKASFYVDGNLVPGPVSRMAATVAGLPANTVVFSRRAFSDARPGVHVLEVAVRQSDGKEVRAKGNFEVVSLDRSLESELALGSDRGAGKARNIIVLIGDGMGIAHRTAARIMMQGVQQGKANGLLAMDIFPYTGLVMTHSLNSIVTDSAPGASCYSSGNKANNNQEGVFPDDTLDKFDNPRVELIGEYLHRKLGRTLGIVTTADVFDATPAAFGVHTQDRGAGTGICDQYLDEAVDNGLRVLMGGGRKWFLPKSTPGSARSTSSDYILPQDVSEGWGVAAGTLDAERDLIAGFQAAGFTYAPDWATLQSMPGSTQRLLGLFAFSNMNVAKDKIDKRRGAANAVVDDFGFPDQPMLDEMTAKALEVLKQNKQGFVLMVEGASIDKQAHNMDSDRWILEAIEFDHAVAVCKKFAEENPDTLVVVTADHECAGINIIGGSKVTNARLQGLASSAGGASTLRQEVVGTYEEAGFPVYRIADDGYPATTDPDYKMLIGYAANSDRYEDWLTNPRPLQDSQQPFVKAPPLNTYPANPLARDTAGNFLITGQVPGSSAVHTASDIPLSAFGPGASQFSGVMDNTDAFFKMLRAAMSGGSAEIGAKGR